MSRMAVVAWLKTLALASAILLSAVTLAQACPAGTVFSPFGGNCHWKGLGNSPAVTCSAKNGACPSGTVAKKGEARNYCCPTTTSLSRPGTGFSKCTIRGTAPFCNGQCLAGERTRVRMATGLLGCVTGSKVDCCRD